MRKLHLVGVALVLAASACNDTSRIHGSTASFTVDPTTLDFGRVEVNESKSMDLTLSNEGGVPITIDAIDIQAPFRIDVELPLTLMRAESTTLQVYFEPTELHADGDAFTMVVHNDSEDNPEPKVQLLANSIRPVLVSTPSLIDFGEVRVGQILDVQNIVLANMGNEDVTITDISGLDPSLFTLTMAKQGDSFVNRVIPAGASVKFTLSYKPTSGKVDDTVFVLATTNKVQPKLEIPVKAKGLESLVQLCWHFDGETDICIPRESPSGGTIKADIVNFGIIPERDQDGNPTSKALTVTLKNGGNLEADVIGLVAPHAGADHVQAADKTSWDATKCTSIPVPRPADFTFAPELFAKLDAVGGPNAEQQMTVTYTPRHQCESDLEDKATIWIQVGASMLQLEMKGASGVGMARVEQTTFQVGGAAVDKELRVENTGYGALHVLSVELVMGDAGAANKTTNCAIGCSTRLQCPPALTEGNPIECNVFQWSEGPYSNVTIQPGTDPSSPGGTNTEKVGRLLVDPSVPGFGSTSVVRACIRATTDDLIVPVVCGVLSASH